MQRMGCSALPALLFLPLIISLIDAVAPGNSPVGRPLRLAFVGNPLDHVKMFFDAKVEETRKKITQSDAWMFCDEIRYNALDSLGILPESERRLRKERGRLAKSGDSSTVDKMLLLHRESEGGVKMADGNLSAQEKRKRVLQLSSKYALTDSELHIIEQNFKDWDKTGDGKISAQEFQQALSAAFGKKFSKLEALQMIRQFDLDGSNEIEYDEFFQIMAPKMVENRAKKRLSGEDSIGEVTSGKSSASAAQQCKKVSEVCAKYKLSDSEVDTVEKSFQNWDKDGDGSISEAELQQSMQALLGRDFSKLEVQQMMRAVDVDRSTRIEYDEFFSIMAPKIVQHRLKSGGVETVAGRLDVQEKMKREDEIIGKYNLSAKDLDRIASVFKSYDKDGNGVISHEELKESLAALGHPHTHAEIDRMMQEVDVDFSGGIEYDEFIQLMAPRMAKH